MNLQTRLLLLEKAAMRFAAGVFMLTGAACYIYMGILIARVPGVAAPLLWGAGGGLLLWLSQRAKVRGGFLIDAVRLSARAQAIGRGMEFAGAWLLMLGGYLLAWNANLTGLLALAVCAPLGYILWLLSEEALFAD